jgi:hypothetical protein
MRYQATLLEAAFGALIFAAWPICHAAPNPNNHGSATSDWASSYYQLQVLPSRPFGGIAEYRRSSVSRASFADLLRDQSSSSVYVSSLVVRNASNERGAPLSNDDGSTWEKLAAGVGMIGFVLGRRLGIL